MTIVVAHPDTHCFHCDEPLSSENTQRHTAVIQNETRYFCCPACAAVADAIHHLGLEQYYRQRDNKPQRPSTVDENIHITAIQYDNIIQHPDPNTSEIQLFIPDIHCTSCCWLIEKRLQQLEGISVAQAQFHSHKLIVRWLTSSQSISTILRTLQHIGYHTQPWQPSTQQTILKNQQRQLLQRLGVAGLLAIQIHMVAMGSYFGADHSMQHWLDVVALLMSLPVWFYSADIFFKNAYNSVRNWGRRKNGFSASMDLPVAIAIIAAAIASIIAIIHGSDDVYFDSIAMFVFLLLSARFLEAQARNRLAGFSQEPQLPQTCMRLSDNNPDNTDASNRQTINIHQLQARDIVWLENGMIPVDGKILSGTAAIEQAAITGEFLPVQKKSGDYVLAGTTLLQGALAVQAESWDANSHLANLHRRMEQALADKQQRQFMARTLYERVTQWFTPVVLLIASSSALYWYFVDASKALTALLAVLVASCPCALTLAVPAALTAATLQLRKQGILITGSHVLQILPTITHYVFDKTGTLTHGTMHIIRTQLHSYLSEKECIAIASSLEQQSTHPIASAFPDNQASNTFFSHCPINNILHNGIEAEKNNDLWRLGKHDWACNTNKSETDKHNDHSLDIYLTKNREIMAEFSLGDPLRDTALNTIQQLQQQEIHCTILSGDQSGAVDATAHTLNITQVHKNCSPEQKVQLLNRIRQQHNRVLMVGDGINDGPVLGHADISVALADASQTAQLAADVILLNNSLRDLLTLKQVALHTRTIARQNLLWALAYNVCILPLAASGWLTPVYAAIGMAMSSLLVTLNALRLFPTTRISEVKKN